MTTTGTQSMNRGDPTEDSTQKGCTSILLLSCVILTITTAFVFGWGIAAPNMYNQYTEQFLKGNDPCSVQSVSNINKTTEGGSIPAPAPVPAPVAENNQEATDENENDIIEAQVDAEGNDLDEIPVTPATEPKEPFNFGRELIKGIPQTIFLIGAFLGAVTGPFWANLLDRKRTVFANYIFCFGSSLCVLLAYYFTQPWLFYLSRLLLGYQGGMACAVVPPFLGEIASQKVRGMAGAAFQLSLTIGILFAQVIGLPFIAGSCQGWGWGLAIVFLLPLAGMFFLFILPNSPTQMFSKFNDEDQARADLKKLRATENIQADIDLIREQTKSSGSKTDSLSMLGVLKSPRYRWPMITTIVLQFGQALSGVNAVFFYSSKMFAKAGIPSDMIPYANIFTGLINVIATIIALPLIEKLGRRFLIIYPMCVMIIVFAVLTALVQINEKANSTAIGIVTVIFILIFIVCFAIGLGPIPYLYSTEVCRPEARDSVQSLGLIANYIGNILLSLFFPALNSVLGGYVFLIFLVLVLFHVSILFFKMPETKNKSIEETEKFWNIPQTPTSQEQTQLTKPIDA